MGNDDLGIGATFLTEMKQEGRMNMNLNTQSPDTRSNAIMLKEGQSGMLLSPSPSPGFNTVSGNTSPNSNSMLVSFNFLTQVPIEEFVIQEHSKASKLSARLKTNASIKIERELERKIEEKKQRARLDKVLAAADLKMKTDVKELKMKEEAKREKVHAVLEAMKRKERIQ